MSGFQIIFGWHIFFVFRISYFNYTLFKCRTAYINRGLAYYYQGDYEKAIADYTSALELDPYNYNAFHNRSLAYQRLAEVKEQRN
ncbi:tetratricopeptide repeat protein [Coleofasciculus sp. E2-BRE-01]|uniref:tetratricopeptide repeat protein n=1 Tax=Coleofasciculus sp. E2-BRE-01 TaxID=3069524 RepID=UPI0032F620A5